MLGRTVRWREWGIESEADPKHRRLLLQKFGLDGVSARPLDANGVQHTGDAEVEELLPASEASRYRACVARLNYLGQDSPEVQFPAKELSKRMSRPRVGDWARLKKTLRFFDRSSQSGVGLPLAGAGRRRSRFYRQRLGR